MTKKYAPKRLVSYVVASDNGLAPNINGGICSLTVCKPVVRKVATVGEDWILGFSTSKHGRNRLIYAMQVDEKIPLKDFFDDPRFKAKKPSADNPKGDNFFKWARGKYSIVFKQAAHFGKDDKIARDLKSPYAVIGHRFWYFGANAPELPAELCETNIVLPDRSRRGHRINSDEQTLKAFEKWISQYKPGVHGPHRDPVQPS